MGGYDQENGGQLFFLDDLASYKEVPYCGHGYGGMFGMSILDKYCHESK